MRTHIRRAGIAVLVTSLVTSLLTTTQAGVIPWLYDAIFGPAYPQYYGGYQRAWNAGYGVCAPSPCAPCNPCRVGYVPRSSACPSGVCSTTAAYGPCGTVCSTEVACSPASSGTGGNKLIPSQDDLPPAPQTFGDSPVPDPVRGGAEVPAVGNEEATRDVEHTQATVSGVAAPDDAAEVGTDAGFGAPERTSDPVVDEFAAPVIRDEAEETQESPQPAIDDSLGQPLGLDNRTSWRAPVALKRVGMRAGFRNARIARHIQTIKQDYVISGTTATQIASN